MKMFLRVLDFEAHAGAVHNIDVVAVVWVDGGGGCDGRGGDGPSIGDWTPSGPSEERWNWTLTYITNFNNQLTWIHNFECQRPAY